MKYILVTLLLFASVTSAQVQPSPDGTRIPPGQIVDAQGVVWKLDIIRPGGDVIPVIQMVYCRQTVYALNGFDHKWYTGKPGTSWTVVGATDPCK